MLDFLLLPRSVSSWTLCIFPPHILLCLSNSGGMATVKVALDPLTGRKVAVKIVDKEKLANPREQVSFPSHPSSLYIFGVLTFVILMVAFSFRCQWRVKSPL